jgi:hypothetical protein
MSGNAQSYRFYKNRIINAVLKLNFFECVAPPMKEILHNKIWQPGGLLKGLNGEY